jgi:hypothetical protein
MAVPAYAANNKFVTESPEQPLHRRAILLGIVAMLALQAIRYIPPLPARRQVPQGE